MKLKRILYVIFGVVAAAGIAVGGLIAWAGSEAQARIERQWDFEGKDFPIPFALTASEQQALLAAHPVDVTNTTDVPPPPDFVAIATKRAAARGKLLMETRLGCVECHGKDLQGKLVADAMPVWKWVAPNITSGGKTAGYTAADWDRILRHGVRKDGQSALMPAEDYVGLADREVSDIAMYVQTVAASDVQQPPTELGPVGKVLLATGKMPISVEDIDHKRVQPVLPPRPAVNLEFGRHVAQVCVGCHRVDYSGGPIAQGPPEWPPAANLTVLQQWSQADFFKAMRDGVRPDGREISEVMPWQAMKHMSDVELSAMFLYFQTLDAKPNGE